MNTQPDENIGLNIHQHLDAARKYQIWAVGGGKGGVGKSLVTANLSICLALMNYKVVAIDLDLGGANLHTCLGIPIPPQTLSDYLSRKIRNLNELLTPTPIENLSIISGAQDDLGIANLKQMHKAKLLSKLNEIDADFILFDLGAGTSYNTLDFFISADKGILVSLPEPTSIENTYRFIKSVYHRKLKMVEELIDINPLIDQAINAKMTGDHGPSDIINAIKKTNPEKGLMLQREIQKLTPHLIINQVRTQADIDIGHSMKIICRKYFGINIDYVGHLDYDATVWQSVKKRRPLLMEYPNSTLVSSFDKMVYKILDLKS